MRLRRIRYSIARSTGLSLLGKPYFLLWRGWLQRSPRLSCIGLYLARIPSCSKDAHGHHRDFGSWPRPCALKEFEQLTRTCSLTPPSPVACVVPRVTLSLKVLIAFIIYRDPVGLLGALDVSTLCVRLSINKTIFRVLWAFLLICYLSSLLLSSLTLW